LNFRQFSYFVAIAEHRSFQKASQALHISQPSVSSQIKLLEEELDVQLFPDGHFKFPHLWPVKFPQAGRLNYQSFGVTAAGRRSW
jgi:hypothetical protein